MKLFDELKKYCNNNGIRLQIDVFRKDKNRYELTFDNYSSEELKNIRNIISDYAKIEDDVYLAGNGRAIDIYFETLDESKKSTRKSIKESVKFNKEKDIYIAQIKDSSISFAYTPIDTDDDFNGYFVFDGDDVIEYLNWKGADDNDMLKAFDNFEKAVKKYSSKEDAKIIIKDFHDKLGI